jgi:hypothetical protein
MVHPVAFKVGSCRLDADTLRQRRRRLEGSGGGSPWRMRELDIAIAKLDREDREVREILEQRTALSGHEAATLVQESATIDASYARNVGIIHEVLPVTS